MKQTKVTGRYWNDKRVAVRRILKPYLKRRSDGTGYYYRIGEKRMATILDAIISTLSK